MKIRWNAIIAVAAFAAFLYLNLALTARQAPQAGPRNLLRGQLGGPHQRGFLVPRNIVELGVGESRTEHADLDAPLR